MKRKGKAKPDYESKTTKYIKKKNNKISYPPHFKIFSQTLKNIVLSRYFIIIIFYNHFKQSTVPQPQFQT